MNPRRAEVFDWALLGLMALILFGTVGAARTMLNLAEAAQLTGRIRVGVLLLIAALFVAAFCWLVWGARLRRPAPYLQLAGLAAAYGVILRTLSGIPVERIHLLEYGAVGLLAFRALRHRLTGRDQVILATLITLNVGLGDEIIQGLVGSRYYDTKDVMINLLAGLLGVLTAKVVAGKPSQVET